MIPAIKEGALALFGSVTAIIIAKATITTLLALTCTWATRKSRAAVRHALLAAAFGVLLLLPVASSVAPSFHIEVPVSFQNRTVPAFIVSTESIPPRGTAPPKSSIMVAPRSAEVSLSTLVLAGWFSGTVLFLLPVVIGLWQIRSLCRSAVSWPYGQLLVERLAREAGIQRRIAVLVQDRLQGPMTCGILHPAIVLSADAQTWREEDLKRALIHELEHVRRCDWLSHCVARVATAVYWFHPFVWFAWRRLVLEAEKACDDAVVSGSEATAYADQLVGVAERRLMAPKSPLLAMANRADLAARVGAVLDSRQRRGRAGTLPVTLACAIAVVLVVVLSPLTVIAAPQAGTAALPKFEVATVKPSPPSKSDLIDINLGTVRNGIVTLTNVTLNECLKFAYGLVSDAQISGPDWANSRATRFDIVAKAPPDTDRERALLMMQSLLSERLRLAFHEEQRELPYLALTVAKNGPKLHEAAPGTGGNTGSRGRIRGEHMTMPALAMLLSRFERQTIVDMTGLKNQFEVKLEWAPDPISGTPGDDGGGPSIFTAVQDQLGLKLEARKGPLDVLVVDHAEKVPLEN